MSMKQIGQKSWRFWTVLEARLLVQTYNLIGLSLIGTSFNFRFHTEGLLIILSLGFLVTTFLYCWRRSNNEDSGSGVVAKMGTQAGLGTSLLVLSPMVMLIFCVGLACTCYMTTGHLLTDFLSSALLGIGIWFILIRNQLFNNVIDSVLAQSQFTEYLSRATDEELSGMVSLALRFQKLEHADRISLYWLRRIEKA
ncbi:MAG: hypothetical protein R3F51_19710 [Cyanobacteriota/Melainabacteria group bacterium]